MNEKDGLLNRRESHEVLLLLEEAGLTSHLVRKMINVYGNKLAKKMVDAISDEEVGHNIESRFKQISEFVVDAPKSFTLNGFIKKYAQTVLAPHWGTYLINDETFHPSYPLVPGKKLAILYEIQKDMTSAEDCYCFLETTEAHFPNAQWLALAWEQNRKRFFISKTTYGLDYKENLLFQDDGYHIAGINNESEERASFFATSEVNENHYFHKGEILLMIKDI